MGPGGEHEQTAFGAGIELFAMRLRERSETVFHDDDGGEFGIKGSTHDTLFARGDGRRDKDSARTCGGHVTAHFVLKLCFIVATRDADGKAVGSVEKGKIADAVVGMRADMEAEEGAEVFRVKALHEQASRVVFDIIDEGGEHVVALTDQVVVVRFEEETMMAVLVALAKRFLLRHCRSIH